MRLVAIYNVWHDWEMLKYSLKNIRPLVDGVIIVGSTKSNFGEISEIPHCWRDNELHICEPQFSQARMSETYKRNHGLQVAREQGYTHFLSIDSDEFYDPDEFKRGLKRFQEDPNLKGIVVPCQTYFKKPTLTIGFDITLVPFVHELTPTIKHEFNRDYPFSWDGKQIRIDPTRSYNINGGNNTVCYDRVVMHHMSWIRRDYNLKIRNSTARTNLERSTILEDLANAAPGVYCKFYQKTLTECTNPFGIPEF